MENRKNSSVIICGERIYLREVRVEDVNQAYYRWMNDREVTRYLESRFFPHSLESLQEFVRKMAADQSHVFLAICLKEDKRHIGNAKLGPINWIHRYADLGLIIGEKDCWGQGYASEVIGCLVSYAFNILDLHKLIAGCYEAHQASLKAFQKNGFRIEGIRKKQYRLDGKYVNAVTMGLIESEQVRDEN